MEDICHQPGVSNKPQAVVHRLLDILINSGYCVYVDNFYCCPTQAHSLTPLDTGVVGTVRANRVRMPKDLVTQPFMSGQMD